MDRAKEPMWERLKRREELRKTEVATGGRKKYVSPLELFRMELDAEAAERNSSGLPSGEEAPSEERRQDCATSTVCSEEDKEDNAATPKAGSHPPSPDDCEAAAQLERKSARAYVEAHESDHQPDGHPTVVFTRESWLKCMFPFKQCRKAVKSATRTLGVVDMSTTTKDTFFRNPLYKNKLKAAPTMATVPTSTRSKNTTHGNVEKSSVSVSSLSKVRMGRRRSVEKSDRSKCRVVAATIPDEQQQPRRRGNESAREHERIARLITEAEIDAFMGEPVDEFLVRVYRHPPQFPFGKMYLDSPSPVTKSKSYRSVGALKKALLGARCYPEVVHRMTSSASPDPPSVGHRKSSDTHGLHRQDSCEEERSTYVVSRTERRNPPFAANNNNGCNRDKKKDSAHLSRVPVSCSVNGRADRLMAMEMEKSKANAGSRTARDADESPSDHGFTAFVPFQGFAAFAHHGGSKYAEQTTLTRSLESQCSSTDGSQISSLSNRESQLK